MLTRQPIVWLAMVPSQGVVKTFDLGRHLIFTRVWLPPAKVISEKNYKRKYRFYNYFDTFPFS
ncbi:hypothetical protein LINPERPRIM_LOCUS16592, partial [Linum perenne]